MLRTLAVSLLLILATAAGRADDSSTSSSGLLGNLLSPGFHVLGGHIYRPRRAAW